MNPDLWFKLLAVVVEVVITLAGTVLIAWLRSHIKASQLEKAITIAETVVPAVEQVFVNLHGLEKLDEAIAWAKKLAASHGVELSDEQWQALVERAVYYMNQQTAAVKDLVAGDQ